MKLFLRPKGYITSRFAGTESYREWSHTGIDFMSRFRGPIYALADGVVYKIKYGSSNLQEFRTVYQICETPLGPMEVAYVHIWEIKAIEGFMPQGSFIATEGNTGKVFSGGIEVRPDQKPSGRGAHLHASVRPLTRTLKIEPGEHYIRNLDLTKYKDEDGNYYKITHKDNGSRGWIDYEQWLFTPTRLQLVGIIGRWLGWISHKVEEIKR